MSYTIQAFTDVLALSGISYRWKIEGKRPIDILQGIGNGCAFLDADGDGNLDVLLVGPRLALYRGDGNGHFTDVSHESELDKLHGQFLGCAVGDYDNDGFEDIYITAHAGGVLLHNEPAATSSGRAAGRHLGRVFRNVTATAGISPQPWGTSASFVDMDNDGRLDLYIGNYVEYGPTTQPRLCNHHGIDGACGPHKYNLLRGVMYRNLGGGRFADVTKSWGLDRVSGRTLGVAAAPLAGDRPALLLSNDAIAANLISLKGASMVDSAVPTGIALFPDGTAFGGMGADWGDYDGDGKLDLLIATFVNQAKCIYHNEGSTFTLQDTQKIGTASSIPYVAFGAKWIDYDNDGRLDFIMANGQVQDNIAEVEPAGGPGAVFRQPTMLFHNVDGQRFEDAAASMSAAARPIVGRGLATGDFDNDGRVDALVVDSDGSPLLLRNTMPRAGHWLTVRLVGNRCNRDGFGAVITAQLGTRKVTQHCHADGSYMSASDKRVHFGLGTATSADRLAVQWPDGHVDRFSAIPADQEIVLTEGSSNFAKRVVKKRS